MPSPCKVMHINLIELIFREDKARIKLPRNMEDAKGLGRALSNYTDEYFTQVLVGFVVIYILYPFDCTCNAVTVTSTLS